MDTDSDLYSDSNKDTIGNTNIDTNPASNKDTHINNGDYPYGNPTTDCYTQAPAQTSVFELDSFPGIGLLDCFCNQ